MQNSTKFKIAAKYGTSYNGSGKEPQPCGSVLNREIEAKKRWQIKLYKEPKSNDGTNTPSLVSQDNNKGHAPIETRFLKINFIQAAEDIHGLHEHGHTRDGQNTSGIVKKSVEIRFDTIPAAIDAQAEIANMPDEELKMAILQENLHDVLADKLGLENVPVKEIKQPPRIAILPPYFMAS